MNLNSSLQSMLDTPTKAFEVALRCFVADNLLCQYPDEQSLKDEIQKRIDAIKGTHIILSGKIASSNILSAKEWPSFWSNTLFSRNCFLNKEHTISHDVVFLSQTILMTYLFQDLHGVFISSFGSPEMYLYHADKYYQVRNALSHQASTIITDKDAQESIQFMRKRCQFIDTKYFWFRSSLELEKDMDIFETALLSKKPAIDNFDSVPFPSNVIVCREPELSSLFKYICGWDGTRKLRNRKHLVCVSGYGGIGKTSLVTEFISRLLNVMQEDSYDGLRPAFILFYSAKMQFIEFDQTSGSLYVRNRKKQFFSCEDLLAKFYKDLSIEGFDDNWQKLGILIIDNLETLNGEERAKIIDYINYELPSSIQVIITTRIPEHADETITLRGFQSDAGLDFINEYLTKNQISIDLTDEQKNELTKYSYGNSLVLVLALKRMASKKSSYRAIINELKQLPKSTDDNSISQFMFQNTIEELYSIYPQISETIKSVLICLSLRPEALSADVLALAHKDSSIDEIDDILQLLTQYLVVEKAGDSYSINEFANHFIMTSLALSSAAKAKWESNLLSAMHMVEEQKMSVDEFKLNYPKLSEVLSEWCGTEENENLAICHAFTLYEYKKIITSGNAAYEIDNMNREFDYIEHMYSAHPYVFYQRARILKELRQDHIIGDEYNHLIKSNYDSCLMMINSPSFAQIKNTRTYPSILWIYAMFLLSSNSLEPASHYADDAVKNFERLSIKDSDYDDALLIYGIAEIGLFALNLDKNHLKNARNVAKKFEKKKYFPKNVQVHYDQLTQEIAKYNRFKI